MKFFYNVKRYFQNLIDAIIIFDQRSIFKAQGEIKELYGIKFREHKKVNEINQDKITTYPRFSLYENDSNTKDGQKRIIFDSSDFWYVNNVFGKSTKSFQVGSKLYFNDCIYEITEINVDILDVFDDYSTKFRDNTNHTDKYKGETTPYNIQIFIIVNFLDYNF